MVLSEELRTPYLRRMRMIFKERFCKLEWG